MGILLSTHYPEYVDADHWVRVLNEALPEVRVCVWPDLDEHDRIELMIGDFAAEGVYASLRNLKCFMYIGAGVDAILRDPQFPRHIPLVRSDDHAISFQVAQYVVLQILDHHRHGPSYRRQQAERIWHPIPTADTRSLTVGLLGYGRIAKTAARVLRHLELKVWTWSRTPKAASDGITHTYGDDGLCDMLSRSDYVVCALPLTPQTQGIVNRNTILRMKRGTFFINVGRGGHIVDGDFLEALDDGHLSGAALDVFYKEPLPIEHRYWAHPRVILTPHVANFWVDGSLPQVVDVWQRLKGGLPLTNVVDPDLGY
jgi:glyoxylate/hydroxypyruvate reductase A